MLIMNCQQREGCLVTLPSTRRNLEAVGLAVCRGHPVLLEGVVGCGKTSIVEHLACVTGRIRAPALTKVSKQSFHSSFCFALDFYFQISSQYAIQAS